MSKGGTYKHRDLKEFIIDKQVKGAIAENLAKNYFLNNAANA